MTVSATGGDITYLDGYKIHTFRSSGTFTVTASGNVEALVVAGGGAGGVNGGGGGAGGLIYTASLTVGVRAVTVTVGAGGVASNGGNSVISDGGISFATQTAIGGGKGSGIYSSVGSNGGSGGGGWDTPSTGTAGQGNAGGIGLVNQGGGGGGGAGAIGGNGSYTSIGGDGGAGLQYSVSGAAEYYAGGGGGAGAGGTSGGVGGGGGCVATVGVAGTDGTGGGGGSGAGQGGDGGDGIVIFRYAISLPSARRTAQNEDLANMSQSTIKGRAASTGTGIPQDLTAAQVGAILENGHDFDFIDFDITPTAAAAVGRLRYSEQDGVLEFGAVGGNVNVQIGQEVVIRVVNKTGVQLNDGQAVYVNGAQGNRPTAALAKADAEATSHGMLGIVTENIANNAEGFVTTLGIVRGYNTSGFTDGDELFLSASVAGELVNTPPTAPNHATLMAIALNSTVNGMIFVRPQSGFELDELHDVSITSATTGDTIIRDGSVWKNMPIYTDTKDPTGWVDPTLVDVSYNTTNRTITLTGTLVYYWRGVKTTLTSPWTSSAHDAADGDYFLYSTDGSTFAWSTTLWTFDALMVAKASKSTSPAYQFAIKEAHGLMPWQVHKELHEQVSSYRKSGGALTAGTYTENTATDAANTPGFDAAVINDEDDAVTIPAWTDGTYTTLRIGASSLATFDIAATLPFRSSGSYILVNNPSTGAETASSNNKYVNIYQVLIPAASDTESQKFRMVMLQPQTDFSTLALAQAEDVRTLSFGNLSTTTPEFVIYARITYVLASGDANTGKCRIATGGITYLTGSRISQTSAIVNPIHNLLNGLQGGTTDEYYHLTSAQNTFIGKLGDGITAAKTLTLTATDNFNLTIPATGTAALLEAANVFTANQTINARVDTDLTYTTTGTVGNDRLYEINGTVSSDTAAVARYPRGVFGQLTTAGTTGWQATSEIIAFQGQTVVNVAIAHPVLMGMLGRTTFNNFAATFASAVGVQGHLNHLSGTPTGTSEAAVEAKISGVVNTTTVYHFLGSQASITATGITNYYGLYLPNISGASTLNYAIYTGTGLVRFGDAVSSTGSILSSNATTGIGYTTGAGGTVTQATNKATSVTLNKVTGLITMNNAALAADTTVTFTLTDSAIAATDTVILNHASAGTAGAYTLNAQVAAGSATINVRNVTAGSLSEAIVIRFTVIKSISA